jgi:hypothetical protein
MKITLFVDNRHVKDIMRSLAHELVHHKQNCRGDFAGGVNTSPGYAQEDSKMRKLEGEAYLEGSGYLFRDWEDTLKKENKQMSNLNESKAALRAASKELKAAVRAAGVSSYKELPASHPARKAYRAAYKAVKSGKQSPESIAQVGDMDKLVKGLSKTVAKSKQPPKKRSFQDITGVSMDDVKGAADRAGAVAAKAKKGPKKRSFKDITGVGMDKVAGIADKAASLQARAKGRKSAQDMFSGLDDAFGEMGDTAAKAKKDMASLEEERSIFAPNHYCVHHGGVYMEGEVKLGKVINHNWNNKLQKVTKYDMEFEDGTILENVKFEDILVTEASLAQEHKHAVMKRDDDELEEEKMPMKTDTEDADEDGETDDKVPAFLDKGETKKKKKTGKQPPQLAKAQGKKTDEAHCPGKRDDEKEETNESWFKGSKDQLLFERLVQKWTK